MKKITPPGQYDQANEALFREAAETEDAMNFKKRQDVRLQQGERLIIKDTVTSASYALTIVSGVFTLTATT